MANAASDIVVDVSGLSDDTKRMLAVTQAMAALVKQIEQAEAKADVSKLRAFYQQLQQLEADEKRLLNMMVQKSAKLDIDTKAHVASASR